MLTAVLVGYGARGRVLLPMLRELPGVRLQAVADSDRHVRGQVQSETGLPSFDPMAEEWPFPPPDLFVVATPVQGRTELIERLAVPGVRGILAEKPLALSLQEFDAMQRACRSSGTALSVFQHWRHCPALAKLRELLATGCLGRIESVRGVSYGNLLDQGWHLLDAARWLLGEPAVTWATAQGTNDRGFLARWAQPDVPVEADPNHPAPLWTTAEFALENRVRVHLECGPLIIPTNAPLGLWHERRLQLVGSLGSAEVRPGHYLKVAGAGPGVREWTCDPSSLDRATHQVLSEFCLAIARGEPVPISADSVRETLAGLVLCGESLRRGEVAVASEGATAAPFRSSRKPQQRLRRSITADDGGPTYSILIPLDGDRHYLHRCLSGWLRQDGVAAEDYELIWLDETPAHPQLEVVEPHRRPQDRVIREIGAGRARLYDLGARASRGRYLVFSESHCRPEREFLRELTDYLNSHDVDGVCCRSIPDCLNAISRADAALFSTGYEELRLDSDWRKVIIHGFALRREAYLAVGGLQPRYELYAEMVLASDLRDAGFRIGFAGGPAVHHRYRHSVFELLEEPSYARGERQYRRDHGSVDRIGFSHLQLCGDVLPSATAREESLRVEWRRLSRGLRIGDLSAVGSIVALLREKVRNGRFARQLAVGEWWLAALACWLFRFNDALTLRAFRALVRASLRYEWSRESVPLRTVDAAEGETTIAASQLYEHAVYGFHPPEDFDGRRLRWSRPTAGFDLPLAAGDYEIEIDTGGVRPWPASLRWSLNGSVIPADQVRYEPRFCRIRLSIPHQPDSRLNTLGLSCQAWDIADARQLGLPIFEIHCRPVSTERAVTIEDEAAFPVLLPFPRAVSERERLTTRAA